MLFPTLFKLHLDTRCFICTLLLGAGVSCQAQERFEIANDSVMKRSANKQTHSALISSFNRDAAMQVHFLPWLEFRVNVDSFPFFILFLPYHGRFSLLILQVPRPINCLKKLIGKRTFSGKAQATRQENHAQNSLYKLIFEILFKFRHELSQQINKNRFCVWEDRSHNIRWTSTESNYK